MAPIDPVRTATLLAEITTDSNGSLLEELTDIRCSARFPACSATPTTGSRRAATRRSTWRTPTPRRTDGLAHFGSDLLVECKSQGDPVSAQDVNWFATKLRRRQQNHGVLIALSGVSGRRSRISPSRRSRGRSDVREKASRSWCWSPSEIAGLQSGEHLAAVLNFKRQELVAGYRMSILDRDTLMALSPTPGPVSDSARLLLHPAASVAGEQAASWQMVLDAGRLQLRRHIRTTLEEVETRRPTAFTDEPGGRRRRVNQAVAEIRAELDGRRQEHVEEADAAMLARREAEHSEEWVKEQTPPCRGDLR